MYSKVYHAKVRQFQQQGWSKKTAKKKAAVEARKAVEAAQLA